MFKNIALLLCLFLYESAFAGGMLLDNLINSIIDRELVHASFSIMVKDPETGDVVFERNSQKPDAEEPKREPDDDKAGIPDRIDLCPNMAEDFDGRQDQDGCPE